MLIEIESLELTHHKTSARVCQLIKDSTVVSAYFIKDQYGRDCGWLLKARHNFAKGAAEWYAVTPDYRCSSHQLLKMKDAEQVLRILLAAYFISNTSCAHKGN